MHKHVPNTLGVCIRCGFSEATILPSRAQIIDQFKIPNSTIGRQIVIIEGETVQLSRPILARDAKGRFKRYNKPKEDR